MTEKPQKNYKPKKKKKKNNSNLDSSHTSVVPSSFLEVS